MKNNIREFHFPTGVKEAVGLLTKFKSKAVLVGGGTRLPRAMAPSIEAIVDISDVPLKHIKADKSYLHIGAMCTLADLERSPLIQGWAGGIIAEAAALGTSAMARSMGTVGGNIVRALPYNNLPPVFLALRAEVVHTDGKREVSVAFEDIMKPGLLRELGTRRLVTEVRIPAETKTWGAAMDRTAMTKTDWVATAICAVALQKKDGVCEKASIALGSIVPRAMRFEVAEMLLEGKPFTEALARSAAKAVEEALSKTFRDDDAKAFERSTTGVIVRRSLMKAFED